MVTAPLCKVCSAHFQLDLGKILVLPNSVHAGLQDQSVPGITALLSGESEGHVGLRLTGLYTKILE